MMKRLELDSLKADLAAVESLLASRTEDDDPVGWLQFSSRKADLAHEITKIEETPDNKAGVALFFGGRPVIGSRGILADFAGKALENYQDMVAKRFAAIETGSPLGERGRVPGRGNAQLMVTEVARGSFGFVLEEATQDADWIETPLKQVVEEVSDLIYRLSLVDEEGFESVVDTLDDRLLGSIRSFLKTLDEAGATLKLVEGQKEFILQREDVERARTRADSMEISERELEKTGMFFMLPDSRKFELYPVGGEPVCKGGMTADCLKEILGGSSQIPADVINSAWKVSLKVREVRQRTGATKISYTLTKLVEKA